jgi:restriction endonuclease S subunit
MRETGDIRIDKMMPRLCETWPVVPFDECLVPASASYRKLKSTDIKASGKIPVIDQGESFISGYTDEPANEYPGALPVIVFGDHTRRFKFVDFKFAIGAQGTHLLYPCADLTPKFFYHYLSALNLESQGYSRHYKFLKQALVPVPRLPEQRRIVAKLEKLLGKADACHQRLAKIPVLLKRFRQSVLAAACSGRLTADWREKIGTTRDEWRRTTVKNVTEKIEYGYTASAKKGGSGPRFVRITDIQQGRVSWDDVPTCDIAAALSKKYALKSGDIVFARTGATTGKSFLIRKCPPAVFASYLIRVQAGSQVLPPFLYLFFQTPEYWAAISENLAGNAQPNCNATKLGQLEFDLPSLAEQQEIVRRVEALFALADQIEARYAKAKAHVEKLAQSILAKAFRGELVPQDPNDEPAIELLKRIAGHGSSRKRKRVATNGHER